MKQLIQNPLFAVAAIAPCAAVLLALEFLHAVPAQPSRLVLLRRVMWVLAIVFGTFCAVVVIARFAELKVQPH